LKIAIATDITRMLITMLHPGECTPPMKNVITVIGTKCQKGHNQDDPPGIPVSSAELKPDHQDKTDTHG